MTAQLGRQGGEPEDGTPAGVPGPARVPAVVAGSRPGRARWLALAAVAAVVLLVCVGVVRAAHLPTGGSPPSDLGASPTTRPAPGPVLAEIQVVLDARAAAVRRRDLAGFGRTSAPGPGTRFDPVRLAALAPTAWSYEATGLTAGPDPSRVAVHSLVRYRLGGDTRDAVVSVELTMAVSGGHWGVALERSTGDRRQPWEVAAISVATGADSRVIGVGRVTGGADRLRRWAREADRAVAAVARVIPTGWNRRVTLVVPATAAGAASLAGREPSAMSMTAAVAVAELGPGAPGPDAMAAYRIYLNTPLLESLTEQGRLIVLRHEITHVALGAPATDATPMWLEEGMAELVGYRGSGVPLAVAVGNLAGSVPSGRVPVRLPVPGDFGGAPAVVAYEQAHLACTAMAEQVGLPGLLRVYRLTAAGRNTADGTQAADANFAAAWREVSGRNVAELTRDWQDLLTGNGS